MTEKKTYTVSRVRIESDLTELEQTLVKQFKSNALVGLAGAYFTAANLSERGLVATVTNRNTEGIER
jgi:hypothetical protein